MSEENKNKIGRPPHFETPGELQSEVDKYFKKPINTRVVSCAGGTEKVLPVLTVGGLGYSLGFKSRTSFYDYCKRSDEFSTIIKRARYFIEANYEAMLQGNNVTGVIFALKNMGWRDKTEVEQTNTITMMGTITKDGKPLEFDIGDKL